MINIRVRPRIRRTSPLSDEIILERFKQLFSKKDIPVIGKVVQHHVVLKIPPQEQHYWSPELHFAVEEEEEGSLIRGLIGPKPSVWTMFMFFYILVGVLGLFGGMYGLSQVTLDMTPTAFWFCGGAGLILMLIFVAAQIGQKKGHEQTEWLLNYMHETLDDWH